MNITAALYDIDCKQSSSANGIFSLKQCIIKQIAGDVGNAPGSTIQQVHYLNLSGFAPSNDAETKDNVIRDVKVEVFPFGNVRNVYVPIQNTTEVDKSD